MSTFPCYRVSKLVTAYYRRLYAQPGSLHCPVNLTLRYFALLGGHTGSVVPQCQPQDRMKPHPTRVINYTSAIEDFRSVLLSCGVNPAGYSEHSMRRGGATEAARQGASTGEIQFAGDWSCSSTAEKYIDASYRRQRDFNQYLV